jgi:hypothetical protein
MNRIAFGTEYRQLEESQLGTEPRTEVELELLDLLEEQHIHINESEIQAILRYLE